MSALVLTALLLGTPPPAPGVEVPYRLTATQHVLVRVKLDGKGPFNFILDTGAPAVFMAPKVAEKAGLTPDGNGWVTVKSFELEGGVKVADARARAENLFQLEGMNGLGIAGVELHGVIGYTVLARYRITYDFTKPKLLFQPLAFDPPPLKGMGRSGSANGGLEAIGPLVKLLGLLAGMKPNFAVAPRGFLGIELSDQGGNVTVAKLLPGGPADRAGVKAGDRIVQVNGDDVTSPAAVAERMAKLQAGASMTFAVERAGERRTITVELGKGL